MRRHFTEEGRGNNRKGIGKNKGLETEERNGKGREKEKKKRQKVIDWSRGKERDE